MQSPQKSCFAEIQAKGSQFLAALHPVRDEAAVEALRQAAWKAHPKARHVCYAYRLGAAGEKHRSQDDGEPSGTAGLPIYQQLLSYEASDAVILVVRYFGGTLLGVPGLIKAYKESARAVLQQALWTPLLAWEYWQIDCDYSQLNHLYYFNQQWGAELLRQELSASCRLWLRVSADASASWAALCRQRGMQLQAVAEAL